MQLRPVNLVWLAAAVCVFLAVRTSHSSRPAVATSPTSEPRPLNTSRESLTPTFMVCRPIVGPVAWDSSAASRLRSIMRDSIAESERASAVSAAFPDVRTFEALETRGCALVGHGVSPDTYASFIDSVVPRVLAKHSSASLAGSAPELIAPASGSSFKSYPRKTTVWWHSVPKADHYLLEVEALVPLKERTRSGEVIDHGPQWLPHGDGLHSALVRDTLATFFFVGAQPGRWRVRAAFSDGRTTPASEWRLFTYLE